MIRGEQLEISVPERFNLGAYFLDVNLEAGRGDKTAIYFKDQRFSFRDLWLLTNKIGNVLRTMGVEAENRVLLVLEDSPVWVAAWLATLKLGAVGTHAYTYLNPSDYEHLLNLVRPKVVVASGSTLPRLREAASRGKHPRAVLVTGDGIPALQPREFALPQMLESAGDELEIEDTHRDDIAFWNFSSGTTGKPKGVPHAHRDAVYSYESLNYVLEYTPDDVFLRVPKLFFHYARDMGCLFALRSGAAVVLFEQRTTAPLIFDLIEKYRPTVLVNVPTMMRAMIELSADRRADLSGVRLNLSSGERLSARLYQDWIDTFGVEVTDRFGSAESGIGYLSNRPGAVVPGSGGTVAPLVEVKLVDGDGREVPSGEPGILMTHSEASAQYYVREREKSKATFPGGNWINTRDLFRQDENERFWYVGRADDMVKVGGVWASTQEIEHGLLAHPDVRECAVLAVQNEDGLTAIEAFLVLRSGRRANRELHDDIKGFCQGKLGPHKYPGAVHVIDELPKTGQGKVDRRLLREMAL